MSQIQVADPVNVHRARRNMLLPFKNASIATTSICHVQFYSISLELLYSAYSEL